MSSVKNKIWSLVEVRARYRVWRKVGLLITDQIWDQVGDQVGNRVGQVGLQVGLQVENQVRN